jgi:hypothetical protein
MQETTIYRKLLAAQKTITGIAKTGHNKHFDYAFFEEREVLKVAREALNDAGLAFFYSVEGVQDREVKTTKGKEELLTDVFMVCTIADAESGETFTGKAIGRGQDGQDKGVNKAIVAGLKYWLLKTLMIPTNDDTERDEHTNPDGNAASGQKAQAPQQRPAPRQAPSQGGAFDMDGLVGFGKYKTATWRYLLQNDPDYVQWTVENMEKMYPETREGLKAALANTEGAALSHVEPWPGEA